MTKKQKTSLMQAANRARERVSKRSHQEKKELEGRARKKVLEKWDPVFEKALKLTTRFEKAMDLLEEAAEDMENHPAPNKTWFKRYFELTGQHMVLIDEGWVPGDLDREDVEILDEVNKPNL